MRVMPGGALERDQQDSSSGTAGGSGGTSATGGGSGNAGSGSGNVISSPSSMYVGRKLDEHRGAFVVEYPMDKGVITDNGWDAMECLWEVCVSI
jgi:hypothetical protein